MQLVEKCRDSPPLQMGICRSELGVIEYLTKHHIMTCKSLQDF